MSILKYIEFSVSILNGSGSELTLQKEVLSLHEIVSEQIPESLKSLANL